MPLVMKPVLPPGSPPNWVPYQLPCPAEGAVLADLEGHRQSSVVQLCGGDLHIARGIGDAWADRVVHVSLDADTKLVGAAHIEEFQPGMKQGVPTADGLVLVTPRSVHLVVLAESGYRDREFALTNPAWVGAGSLSGDNHTDLVFQDSEGRAQVLRGHDLANSAVPSFSTTSQGMWTLATMAGQLTLVGFVNPRGFVAADPASLVLRNLLPLTLNPQWMAAPDRTSGQLLASNGEGVQALDLDMPGEPRRYSSCAPTSAPAYVPGLGTAFPCADYLALITPEELVKMPAPNNGSQVLSGDLDGDASWDILVLTSGGSAAAYLSPQTSTIP